MRAEGARHLSMIWQSRERCWEWWALKYGHAQGAVDLARGRPWGPWWRRNFTFHVTPIHISRWSGELEIGVCLGRRTLYVMRHK